MIQNNFKREYMYFFPMWSLPVFVFIIIPHFIFPAFRDDVLIAVLIVSSIIGAIPYLRNRVTWVDYMIFGVFPFFYWLPFVRLLVHCCKHFKENGGER